MELQLHRAAAATEPHRLFLAVALLTQVVAVVQRLMEQHRVLEEQAAVALVLLVERELLERQTQAVAVERAPVLAHLVMLLAALAAPVSSSSNTTSALPRSLPSSPRRSGLHRLVRSALTTSL
jgi:hypothetical protein